MFENEKYCLIIFHRGNTKLAVLTVLYIQNFVSDTFSYD